MVEIGNACSMHEEDFVVLYKFVVEKVWGKRKVRRLKG